MIDDNQIYVIVDIETDGPVAGLYSMLSIGAVATTAIEEVATFYRKVKPLEGASRHPSTMAWWKTQPQAWQEVMKNTEPAETVIKEFYAWVQSLGKQPIFVAHPIGFDYSFVSWYLWKFIKQDPFTNETGAPQTLDLGSYIAGKFGLKISTAKRNSLPDWMKEGMPKHSHNALDDAMGYGAILRNMLKREL